MNGTDPLAWWNYVEEFQAKCTASTNVWNKECSTNAMNTVGIPRAKQEEIAACVGDSRGAGYEDFPYNGMEDSTNSIYEEQIIKMREEGVYSRGAININRTPYRGETFQCTSPLKLSTCGVLQVCVSFIP